MFELHTDWWDLPLRATIIYLVLLVLVRVSGRRTVGQFTPFDLLVVMLLSEAVSNGLSGGEDSVSGALLAAGTLVVLNVLVALFTSRSDRVQALVEGLPVLIGRDGKIFRQVLERERVPLADALQALREADCAKQDMKFLFLEADGQISVLKDASPPNASEDEIDP